MCLEETNSKLNDINESLFGRPSTTWTPVLRTVLDTYVRSEDHGRRRRPGRRVNDRPPSVVTGDTPQRRDTDQTLLSFPQVRSPCWSTKRSGRRRVLLFEVTRPQDQLVLVRAVTDDVPLVLGSYLKSQKGHTISNSSQGLQFFVPDNRFILEIPVSSLGSQVSLFKRWKVPRVQRRPFRVAVS